ncbi:unnamed protein product [Staurois parvus]|uniref:Uncharacterized protein n=1 Tax=Staurois parvus TaxID=386267 RepID=A0ABN9EHI5_9NEOB|nr:unnamed protein product [Staurois parvus]
MGDIERQLRWALICGINVHWYVALMGTGTGRGGLTTHGAPGQ